MIFKNLLFGFGGTAVIGGVGYGIYASSQSNGEEKTTIGKQEEVLGSETDSDVSDGGSTQKEEKSPDKPEKNSEGSNVPESSETAGGSSEGDSGA